MPRLYNKHLTGDVPGAISISRPLLWANPFEPGRDGTREEVIAKYEAWMLARPALVAHAKRELAGRDLLCWCAPEPCHGEVLLRLVNDGAQGAPGLVLTDLDRDLSAPAQAHSPAPPFAHTSGPRSARVVILGDTWGETESQTGQPFSGESGKELWRMLGEAWPEIAPEEHRAAASVMKYGNSWVQARGAWLAAADVLFTNVLAFRPAGNKLESCCCGKKELPHGYDFPPIVKGKYLRAEYLGELDRLARELEQIKPNLVICLGATASWAMLHTAGIGAIRGNVAEAVGVVARVKCLPTYHPSGVLRNWSWRPIVVTDLVKALREAKFPEIRRPERSVLVNPTLEEVHAWTNETLASPPALLSVDIETGAGQIKCVGFARSTSESLVIPFVDLDHPSGSYWGTSSDELSAWKAVQNLLESGIPILGQNFVYDLQYLTRLGLRPARCLHDTMLLHHSMYPEMQKGLGFLGSIYTNEASWKLMNRRKVVDSKKEKADE
jgi:uracil-DNA glycosylase